VPLNILVIGDSTAENVATALAAASDGSLGVISAGVLGCPLLQVAIVRDREESQQDVAYCPNNGQLVRDSLMSIDAVVIVAGAASGVGMALHDLPLYFAGVDAGYAAALAAAMVASGALLGGGGALLLHRALRRSGALGVIGA